MGERLPERVSTPSGAVFLSYASQDAEAAARICDALRAAGIEVWFDQSELRGGDAWDAAIRRQIRDCALFVPVISANTEARGEGYFRLEWRLAVERSYQMADDQSFLMPVSIDETNEATARVPDRFRERQWTRLAAGETAQAFTTQVRRTLTTVSARAPLAPAPQAKFGSSASAAPTRRRLLRTATVLVALAVVVALIAELMIRSAREVSRPLAVQPAATTASTPPTLDRKAIAVLPFVNLTGRAEDAYLTDGLQEEILNALARIRDLKVISRVSSSEFRSSTPNLHEVGHRLGVGSVLEGSVRREGQKLRLTVQLIDTRNDRHVLAANYDRDLGHILGLQSEVARKVADALAATLTGYERNELERVSTNNGDAYSLYLGAVALGLKPAPDSDPDWSGAQRLLNQALRLDPDYADAAALLSQACTWMFFGSRSAADGDCARKYYERALTLDPHLPEARLARGLYEMYIATDLDQAIIDLDGVVQLRPNSATAHSALGLALRRKSRFDQALEHFTRAWDLDPLSHSAAHLVITTSTGLRHYSELIDQRKLYQQRFPSERYGYIGVARTECLVQHSLEPLRLALREHGDALSTEDRNRAEAVLARAEGRYRDAARLMSAWPTDPLDRNLRLGFLYWAAGDSVESKHMFSAVQQAAQSKLRQDPQMTGVRPMLALALSMLGEHAASLAAIEAAREAFPEAREPVNGPPVSFVRSIILMRAGRSAEAYTEVQRLLRVPFGAPADLFDDGTGEMLLLVKNDAHYDEIVNHPPRL